MAGDNTQIKAAKGLQKGDVGAVQRIGDPHIQRRGDYRRKRGQRLWLKRKCCVGPMHQPEPGVVKVHRGRHPGSGPGERGVQIDQQTRKVGRAIDKKPTAGRFIHSDRDRQRNYRHDKLDRGRPVGLVREGRPDDGFDTGALFEDKLGFRSLAQIARPGGQPVSIGNQVCPGKAKVGKAEGVVVAGLPTVTDPDQRQCRRRVFRVVAGMTRAEGQDVAGNTCRHAVNLDRGIHQADEFGQNLGARCAGIAKDGVFGQVDGHRRVGFDRSTDQLRGNPELDHASRPQPVDLRVGHRGVARLKEAGLGPVKCARCPCTKAKLAWVDQKAARQAGKDFGNGLRQDL